MKEHEIDAAIEDRCAVEQIISLAASLSFPDTRMGPAINVTICDQMVVRASGAVSRRIEIAG